MAARCDKTTFRTVTTVLIVLCGVISHLASTTSAASTLSTNPPTGGSTVPPGTGSTTATTGSDVTTQAPPATTVPGTMATSPAATTATPTIGKLGDLCRTSGDCGTADSECDFDVSNSGTKRCQCKNGYLSYSNNSTTTSNEQFCGYVLSSQTTPNCSKCERNRGTCYRQSTSDTAAITAAIKCKCPISQTGELCEEMRVNVTCEKLHMKICYNPHQSVNFSSGWTMETTDSYGYFEPRCHGYTVVNETTWCSAGYQALDLDLAADQLKACGTQLATATSTKTYINTITVHSGYDSAVEPIVFQTFCTYKSFDDQSFAGLGVYWINGNSNGEVVNPDIALNVIDRFGDPIKAGVKLRVDDLIKFRISLNRTGTYGATSPEWCSASTSPVIPNQHAETIPIINDGCPLPNVPGKTNSWYWTVHTTNDNLYEIESGLVSAFKLSSSNTIYIHCTLKLCLVGAEGNCKPLTGDNCSTARRKKRAVNYDLERANYVNVAARQTRSKRAVADSYDVLSVYQVYDSDESGAATLSAGGIAGIVTLLIVVVVILVLIGAVMAYRLKRQRKQYELRHEMFAMPRLQAPYNRF